MLCGQFMAERPKNVHTTGTGGRRVSSIQPQGTITSTPSAPHISAG